MVECPNCGSTRIGRFRLDSDWGGGGDWSPINVPDIVYTQEDTDRFESNSRPDIDCYVCCVCSTCFE